MAAGPHPVSPATAAQIDSANATGRLPVVFIHGLSLLARSWERRAIERIGRDRSCAVPRGAATSQIGAEVLVAGARQSRDHLRREEPRGTAAVAHASFKRQKRNLWDTESVEIPSRGHALTVDNGWREVADTALIFLRRHT
jgi:hypothetical protein